MKSSTGVSPVSRRAVSALFFHGQDGRGTHGQDAHATENPLFIHGLTWRPSGRWGLLTAALALWWLLWPAVPARTQPTAAEAAAAAPVRMSAGQAALLGLVEGLTEYLPVSSTGHLVVVERLLGIGLAQDKTSADAYAICIQGGAILAVLVLYLGRVRAMAAGLAGRDPGGRRLAVGVLVAFLPAVVIGLGAGDLIKQHLFGLWPVVGAWLVGGLAILALAWRRRGIPPQQGAPLEQLSLRQALWIGLGQCLAMWPGVSRSLATIAAALLVGLCVPAAVEFSFLLGLVTLLAATTYEALQHAPLIVETFGWFNPLLGFGVAFISAVVAVKWMVAYLNRHSLAIFGYYRIILAVGIALLLWRGILDAGTGS